jgi:hypothetical protein
VRVLAHGFEQAIARSAPGSGHDADDRLVDESRKDVDRQPGDRRCRRFGVKATDEHREVP